MRLLALVLLLAAGPAAAYTPPTEVPAKLQARANFSGVVVLDSGDGAPFVHVAGLSQGERPVAESDLFDVGSIGKLFTAAAIMQLSEAGKVDLDAPISRYLKDFPQPVGDKVTVAMLLNHTGGLGDVLFQPELRSQVTAAKANHDYYLLVATPGQSGEGPGPARYSNSGYVVLGEIIARVSGLSYEDYMRAKVFAPAGVKEVVFTRADGRARPDMTMGYVRTDFDPRTAGDPAAPRPTGPYTRESADMTGFVSSAAGGVYLRAGDLARVGRGLMDGKIISRAGFTKMCAPIRGERPGVKYGYGCMSFEADATVGHNGARPGMSAWLAMSPKTGRVLAITSNRDGQSMGAYQDIRAALSDPGV